MPTYEYECDEGHEFEVVQGIKDGAAAFCKFRITINQEELEGREGYGKKIKQKECGAPCKRLISKASFKFKGGAPTPKFHA